MLASIRSGKIVTEEKASMFAKYPYLQRRYGTLEGGMVFPQPQMATVDLETIRTGDLEALRQEAVTAKEQKELDLIFYYLRHTLSEIQNGGGHFEYPVPSVERLLQETSDFNSNQLRQQIEMVDVEIQRLTDVKKAIADTYTREMLENALWHRKSIIIGLPNRKRSFFINTLEDVEELLALAKEKHKVLDEGIAYYSKLREGYRAQLQRLTETAPAILKEKLCEIQQVCRNADKAKETMIKMASEYRKKDKIEGKVAITYIENKDCFSTFERQYIHLHSEIIKYADAATLSIPQFPARLNADESRGEVWILEVAKKERTKAA